MKKRFFSVLILIICCVLCMAGCDIFPTNTYDLMKAPELEGEYYPILKALEKAAPKDCRLRYPTGGDRRSAVVLNDINGDGKNEAFAFYGTTDEEMHLCIIVGQKEEWSVVDDVVVTASGVERIDFCDLDANGDLEILVGWESQTALEKQLSVYDYAANKLNQRMLQKYTQYLYCDLDENSKNEIFVQYLSATDTLNRASLYSLESEGMVEISSCMLDKQVKTIVSLIEAPLSNGKQAIYIDEIKSSGAITEVLWLDKGQLTNPLLEETAGENARTSRSASFMCKDVNHDGILEIPVAREIPSYNGEDTAEKLYSTVWCSFNGESLIEKETHVINQVDGYYLVMPEKWSNKIAVAKNSTHRSRSFYACDEKMTPTVCLVELYAYDIKEIKQDANSNGTIREGYEEICRTKDSVIIGRIVATDNPLSITMDELKKMIFLNVQ